MQSGSIILLLSALAFFLNHTVKAGGFNLSIADFFLALLLGGLLISRKVFILRYSLIFFVFLSGSSVAVSLWLSPVIFDIFPNFHAVSSAVIKLIICFMYFVVGTSIANLGLNEVVIRWFAIGATLVAILGVGLDVTGASFFRDTLYFGQIRFKGLMSDPNFYAVLACAAIACVGGTPNKLSLVRWGAISILAISVILSASKTGLVVLLVTLILTMLTRGKFTGKSGVTLLLLFFLVLVSIFFQQVRRVLLDLADRFQGEVPQLQRVAILLSDDPLQGVASGGSGRDEVWGTGLSMVDASPLFGAGVGNYLNVGKNAFGGGDVAHNTYIQLAAEWGGIFTLIFLFWIIFLIVQASRTKFLSSKTAEALVLRNIVIIFMVGSMSLSLNNARMFWVFLGMLAFLVFNRDGKINFDFLKTPLRAQINSSLRLKN